MLYNLTKVLYCTYYIISIHIISTTLISTFENPNGSRVFFCCALRASQNRERRIRGLHACEARAKVELDRMRRSDRTSGPPRRPLDDEFEGTAPTVSMMKPRKRDATGKQIYSTSYEPSKVRCAFATRTARTPRRFLR